MRTCDVLASAALAAATLAAQASGGGCVLLFGNPEYAVGGKPRSVRLADLDEDGDLDMVAANRLDDDISAAG